MNLQFTYILVFVWNIFPLASVQASGTRKLLRTGTNYHPNTILTQDVKRYEVFGQIDFADLKSLLGESSRILQMSMSMDTGTGTNLSNDPPDVGGVDTLIDDDYYNSPPDGGYYNYTDDEESISPVTDNSSSTTVTSTPVASPNTPVTVPVTPVASPTTAVTTPTIPVSDPEIPISEHNTTTVTETSQPVIVIDTSGEETTSSSSSQESESITPSPPAEIDGQSTVSSPNTADIVSSTQNTGAQSKSTHTSEEKLNTGVVAGLSLMALTAFGAAGLIAKRRYGQQQRLYEI